MSQILYKYFSDPDYQKNFIEGKIYFNSLSYFLNCEDLARRDPNEDNSVYRPLEGLEINKLNTGETWQDPSSNALYANIKDPDHIFILCLSTIFSLNLWNRFSASSCIQILDEEVFKKRLLKALRERAKLGTIKNKTLLSGAIEYYNQEDLPGTRHSCPDKIIMSKRANPFKVEQEYRFAFAKKQNAFDVNNMNYALAKYNIPFSRKANSQILKIGDLSDICTILTKDDLK